MIHINADGYVEPCPFCHYAADSVHEKSLPEILASPFFTELRARLDHLPNPRSECLLSTHLDHVRGIAGKTGAFSTERVHSKTLQLVLRSASQSSNGEERVGHALEFRPPAKWEMNANVDRPSGVRYQRSAAR